MTDSADRLDQIEQLLVIAAQQVDNSAEAIGRHEAIVYRIDQQQETNTQIITRLGQQQEATSCSIVRLSESENTLVQSMQQLVNFSLAAEERAAADRAEIRERLAALEAKAERQQEMLASLEAGQEQHQQILNQILRRLDR